MALCYLLRAHSPAAFYSSFEGGAMTGSTSRPGRVDRRDFLQLGGVASAGAMWAGLTRQSGPGQGNGANAPDTFNEATIVQLQMMMAANRTSSAELTRVYLKRIEALDENGPRLNSVIEVNPDALDIAKAADESRRRGRLMGPLHGIPILLKDNIDTGDRQQTTAGSFALAGAPARQDSTVAAKPRDGGA